MDPQGDSYILSLETSSEVCSVALHREGLLVASAASYLPKAHNRVVVTMVRDLLNWAGLLPKALHAIAVSYGPGSYTGLRIGLSAAKGIAYGLNIPLITINTLEILAQGGHHVTALHPGAIGALMDARRGRAYALVIDPSGKVLLPTTVIEVSVRALPSSAYQDYPLYLLGSGAERYAAQLEGEAAIKIIPGISPQAAHMGAIAYTKFRAEAWGNLAYVLPLYNG